MAARKVFSGSTRKCILGIDIGTTYAGMSYCLMEPGRIPEILPVARFPAQDHVGWDSKVPLIIYYDRAGRVKACGAEALQESVVEQAIEHGWEKAEWFKLHLGPSTSLPTYPLGLPALPTTKNALEMFSDFLQYLFQCAKQYIVDSYPNGSALWIEIESSMEFVLTHPNGWEGIPQARMRQAAIRVGLVPDTPHGNSRIHFVTEGEASLHFCVMNGRTTDPLGRGEGVVIIDAGGGTINISSYHKVPGAEGDVFEETARPQSVFSGSIWVSSRAHAHLRAKLHGSRYAGDVDHIRDCFDKTTKLRFQRTDLWQYIKFGRPSDKDEALHISNGQLKLSGEIVSGFFRPSLEAILEALANLAPLSPVSSVLLVGGFAASDWLYSELKMHLKDLGLDVSRPDSYVNRAVSDGAVSYLLRHIKVLGRVSQHTYGIECFTPFDANNPEHRGRKPITDVAGDLVLPKWFSPILSKNTRVSETQEYRQHYCKMKDDPNELNSVKILIRYYRGQDTNPRWIDVEPDQYSILCTVRADTSKIAQGLPCKFGTNGAYYCLDIDMVLLFGLTELKAEICWNENGVEKRGPAKVSQHTSPYEQAVVSWGQSKDNSEMDMPRNTSPAGSHNTPASSDTSHNEAALLPHNTPMFELTSTSAESQGSIQTSVPQIVNLLGAAAALNLSEQAELRGSIETPIPEIVNLLNGNESNVLRAGAATSAQDGTIMSAADVNLDNWLLHDPAEEPAVWPVILWVAFQIKASYSLPELRSTDIDTLLTIIKTQSQADKHIGLWQWDDADEKMLRETFIPQDSTISSWIDHYPHAWQEYISLLDSQDWARLQALTHQTLRPRLAPTEYEASIHFGAILFWTSSNSISTSNRTNTSLTLEKFIVDMVESMDKHLSQALPQRFISCVFTCLLQKFIDDKQVDDFRALMDTWKNWDVTTCLINFRSVLSTVLEFSNLIEGHELPKSLVDIVIRADIHCVCAQIDRLLHDPVAYQNFLNTRDDDTQQLLDLLQDLLDYPLLDSSIRPVIWKALLKLSKKSSRHPQCFAMPDLQLTGPVAGGGFADIWTSNFHNQTVCVKVMRVFEAVDVETLSKMFRKEAIIWRQLAHPNLLPFFGIFYQEMGTRRRLCLVSPWMENGNIYNYLGSNPVGINRLTLVLDVAIGMEHLHNLNLVHGDLKALNVLVTHSGRAVLTDFGLASVAMNSKIPALSSTVHSGGTTRWQAPELLHPDGTRNSFMSDVYAFACVCYEIFTEKVPFFEVAEPAVVWHVHSGNIPQKLPSISDNLWSLMEECWRPEPGKRPLAKDIVARLSAPSIGAIPTNTASDWEPLYTSKFRSSLQEHMLFHFMQQN